MAIPTAYWKARGSAVSSLALILCLAACGGGGGGGGGSDSPSNIPAPPPSASTSPPPADDDTMLPEDPADEDEPAPEPEPAPALIPVSVFDTPEYRRSDGPEYHGAITAYQQGFTGAGALSAIVDTGIDPESHEFLGRIDSRSFDSTGGNRTLESVDGHGTQVARVLAAAKDDRDIHGIAFQSNLFVARADDPGSCQTECRFFESDLAVAVRGAADANADVINLSLGGGAATSAQMRSAISYAVSRDAVIVVAAGNEGPSDNGGNPSAFAESILDAGGDNVIIVGSVGNGRTASSFSNGAGSSQQNFLMALGEGICCDYENDSISTFQQGGQTFVTVYNGTSFAAPQVSGAVALLAEAFPNLTGAQIVDLLLRTAEDAGEAGTDGVYGRGILDIDAAFTPVGTTSIAGSDERVSQTAPIGQLSAPMGDGAGAASGLSTLVTDSFGRAFNYNLAGGLMEAAQSKKLTSALDSRASQSSRVFGQHVASVSISAPRYAASPLPGAPVGVDIDTPDYGAPEYEGARFLAGRVALSLDKQTQLKLGIQQSAIDELARYTDAKSGAFLVSDSATGAITRDSESGHSLALRHEIGGIGLGFMGEQGQIRESGFDEYRDLQALSASDDDAYRMAALMIDGEPLAGLSVAGRAGMLDEQSTVLGARFDQSLGRVGAKSYYADARVDWSFADNMSIGFDMRQMWTDAEKAGRFTGSGALRSNAYALTLTRDGMFGARDRLALRVSQPLRVSGGGIGLMLPGGYDYGSGEAALTERRLSLTPSGREISRELSWQMPTRNGWLGLNGYWRTEPGHRADAADDVGFAVRYSAGF